MTRARELQSRNAAAKSIASHNLRNRRPQRKDILEKQKRIRQLDEAILHGDVATLQRLSVTGAGFVNDGIRRRAWPLLLRTIKGRHKEEFEDDKPSKDEEQVRLDVLRSFTHLASDPNVREAVRRKRQDELSEVIIDVLKRHPRLSYYQGFHDVCTCLITVLGKESATLAAECMALVFFRDCMLDNLEPVLDQLSLMMGIFRLEDPEVLEFLNRSDTLPFFALSWVITWCSHDLQDFEKVARVYDFFLCSNPLMPVYFAAAVVMSRREELFEQECDNAMVHTFLTKFPKNCDLELIISHAHQLFETYPPETLQKRTQTWLDDNSCVRTFNKPTTRLYELDDSQAKDRPMDFSAIDYLLSLPRIKRPKEESALSKYPNRSLFLYRRNMLTMAAFSAASVGTAALLLFNSALFREWAANSGLL